jgi:hypothetical protein
MALKACHPWVRGERKRRFIFIFPSIAPHFGPVPLAQFSVSLELRRECSPGAFFVLAQAPANFTRPLHMDSGRKFAKSISQMLREILRSYYKLFSLLNAMIAVRQIVFLLVVENFSNRANAFPAMLVSFAVRCTN